MTFIISVSIDTCKTTAYRSIRRIDGILLVFAVGLTLLVVHLYHILSDPIVPRRFAFGIAVPLALAVGVLIGGGYLWERQLASEMALRAGGWCLAGATAFGVGAGLTVLYERTYGVYLVDTAFVIANSATGGAALGLLVGIYEVQQREARQQATRRSQQLTVLNRVLRHDIRTTAALIHGEVESINNTETTKRIQEQTDALVELGDRARRIEDLLRDDGTELDHIDLVPVIETVCAQVRQNHPSAEITLSLPETLPVRASPLIEAALRNLIENAVEHTDKTVPRVTVEGMSGSPVTVQIADNGPGIPETELAVLERGYETQLEHTSGLGLWISNWIVEYSGGEIDFETNHTSGTIVTLTLDRPVGIS